MEELQKMINLRDLIKHPEWIQKIKKHDPQRGKDLENLFKSVNKKPKTENKGDDKNES